MIKSYVYHIIKDCIVPMAEKADKLYESYKEIRPQNYAPKNLEGEYVLTVQGKYMQLKCKDEDFVVTAACAPEDKFDMIEGFKILVERMTDLQDQKKKSIRDKKANDDIINLIDSYQKMLDELKKEFYVS